MTYIYSSDINNVKLALRYFFIVHIYKRSFNLKNKIEEIRKSKGVNQEELAKAMGVSRQTISSLENGRYNPSIFLAYNIAKFFDMTIEEVFCFEEE